MDCAAAIGTAIKRQPLLANPDNKIHLVASTFELSLHMCQVLSVCVLYASAPCATQQKAYKTTAATAAGALLQLLLAAHRVWQHLPPLPLTQ